MTPPPHVDLHPASEAVALALAPDPFYQAITVDHAPDAASRHAALATYVSLAIEEGRRYGRCHHPDDATLGAAIWQLPLADDLADKVASWKRAALSRVLGPRGVDQYERIVGFMGPATESVAPAGAWYLSILAIHPEAQGRGLGAALLRPTLLEADRAGVSCYLETFTPENIQFYRRLGFADQGRFVAPHAGEYAVMVRPAT